MVDVLSFIITGLIVITAAAYITSMIDTSVKNLYWIVAAIFLIILLWATLRSLMSNQNYKIDRTEIVTDNIEGNDNVSEIRFSKKLRVEVLNFDLEYSRMKDYSTYRIYLDSLTYIDVKNSKFDSLHLKYGKKLYKE